MIRFLLLFLLPFSLYASKVLSYNIYERTDRVDVMITFDIPYNGIIKQSTTNSKIIIKLEDASIESSKIKKLSSKLLQALTITPMQGYIQIIANVPNSTMLQASKTSDAYGLRLRFTDKVVKKEKQSILDEESPFANLPTKQDSDMSQSYYMVIAILIIGIIILLIIKRKVTPDNAKQIKPQSSSWLFKSKTDDTPQKKEQKALATDNEISIRFQKNIDNENSIVMLDFREQSYLIMMGKGNILLDKFTDDKPTTQEDFESVLQSRHKELDEYMKIDYEEKEPIQIYKEKAASISYGV